MDGMPDIRRSRAVLIGVGRYRVLGQLDAVHNNLSALAEALRDERVWGLQPGNCVIVEHAVSAAAILDPIHEAAREATDTPLVYYAGHGLVDPWRGELHVALTESDPQRIYTAVPYSQVRDLLLNSHATRKVVILDCCYSGRALGQMSGGAAEAVATQASVDGTYVLAAAAENRAAVAPPGARFTGFTGELISVIEHGIAGHGPLLDLDSIYRELLAAMRAKGMPSPQKRDRNTAGQLTLVRNRAYRPTPLQSYPSPASTLASSHTPGVIRGQHATGTPVKQAPEPVDSAQARAARLLAQAEHIAETITDKASKASELSRIAKAVAGDDPDRGARLLAAAERIAETITDKWSKAVALRCVAEAVAVTDQERAARLLADVERIAQTLPYDPVKNKDDALSSIAKAWAAIDPDRAGHVARTITDVITKPTTLSEVAAVIAATDPERAARLLADAERLAQTITNGYYRALALCNMAEASAATNPDLAARLLADVEGIAESRIKERFEKALVLSRVAKAVAAIDPDRATRLLADAERSAQAMTEEPTRTVLVLSRIAEAAAIDPDRAARLLTDAERIAQAMTEEPLKSMALKDVAEVSATSDPGRAERIAQTITNEWIRATALHTITKTVVATDPNHAEHIAQSISDPEMKIESLLGIANVDLCR
jgi:hypothetical protein